MRTIAIALRVVAVASSSFGYGLAVFLTIFPSSKEQQAEYLQLLVVFALAALALQIATEVIGDAKANAENDRLLAAIQALAERPNPPATPPDGSAPPAGPQGPPPPPPPAPTLIGTGDIADAASAADLAGGGTYAAKFIAEQPKPESFRAELYELAHTIKRLLISYHGSLDADSFVSPEVSRALKPRRIVETKHRVRDMTRFDPFGQYSALPVTVKRMAKLADEFERAAELVPKDATPTVPSVFDP